MTITALTDPTQLPNRTQDQPTFDANMANYFVNLPLRAQQENALAANLNSIAAGGAYAIPYTHRTSSSNVGSSSGGMLAVKSTSIQLDTKSSSGVNVAALLNTFDDSTSVITGTLRLQKVGDTSTWAVYTVTSYVQGGSGLYGDIYGTLIESSNGGNPFADNDLIMLSFQRTGDKGDTGAIQTFPSIYVRDEKASGTGPGNIGSTFADRTLNTTKYNSITGASLASNAVTLPAGTYTYVGSAPASATNGHQTRLYNSTDASVIDYGTSDSANNTYGGVNRSFVRGQFTLSASKAVTLQHAAAVGNPGGAAASKGTEVYAELLITKIA